MIATLVLALALAPVVAMARPAAEPLAKLRVDGGMLAFEPQIAYAGVRLTVTGPEGFEVIKELAPGEILGVELDGGDGFYKYELRFSPLLDDEEQAVLAAARDAGIEPTGLEKSSAKKTVQSGAFTIAGGSLIPVVEEIEPKGVLTNGDGVIRNSLCVGLDCPDAPAFDDSTILMMENNTRIKFGDTSASPFPANDWEIEANSNQSGGANYLGFNDCGTADNDGGCATDLVFAVESGVRASALYVESDGDIGIGTSNPVVDIHLVTGNTPTLRLDQDGSSGFAPQVWDIAGNETNFFVRDVTNGSRLPLRIQPGAPTSSIYIAANGNIGIGTSSPSARVDVETTDNSAKILVKDTTSDALQTMLRIENNGPLNWEMVNTAVASGTWQFLVGSSSQFSIGLAGTGTFFRIQSNGAVNMGGNSLTNFVMDAAGNVTINGTLTQLSDVNQKTGFAPVDGAEVLQRLEAIPIQSWSYKTEPTVRHVGPMAQDFYAAFELGANDRGIATLDTSGVALAAIKELSAQVGSLKERIAELEKLLADQQR